MTTLIISNNNNNMCIISRDANVSPSVGKIYDDVVHRHFVSNKSGLTMFSKSLYSPNRHVFMEETLTFPWKCVMQY